MLIRTFRVKEKVQVLDAVTSNWERAVILSLIKGILCSVKIIWSHWPGNAIFSVPEDGKENAAAWSIGKFHEHSDTCVFSGRRNSRKKNCRSTPDGCTGTRWSFLNMLGVSKKELSSLTTLSCPSAHFVSSANLRILRGVDHHAVALYTLCTPS